MKDEITGRSTRNIRAMVCTEPWLLPRQAWYSRSQDVDVGQAPWSWLPKWARRIGMGLLISTLAYSRIS